MMHLNVNEIIWIISGYLFGSLPFGLILTYLAGYGDIRKQGSGNIGATNVLRIAGKNLAFLTLILDGFKGAIITYLAFYFSTEEIALLVAASSVLGHIFPVWLKFKGGKGVATSIAVLMVCNERIGILIVAIWLIIYVLTRISSLSAIGAFILTPIFTWFFITKADVFYLLCFITIIVIIRHYENIKRIIEGKEKKISVKNNG